MTLNLFKSGNANAQTSLLVAYTAGTSTVIAVADASVLPAAPNIVTIADVNTPYSKYIVVEYTGISNNQLTGLTVKRGLPTMTETMSCNSTVRRVITGVEWDAIVDHAGSTSNPHQVTKSQVGLDEVDNTSDANKPVSTATQNALNRKAATTHAAQHGNAGADKVTLDASQVTSGRLAIDRITQNLMPNTSFTWARQTNEIQNTIQFTDTSTTLSGAPVSGRKWDFGDGSKSTLQNPKHTFPAFGIYLVSLTVSNAYGSATNVSSVTVAADPIYGMRLIDAESGPATKIVYTDDAVGMTPCTFTNGAWNMGSWLAIINECVKPCVLSQGAASVKYLDITNLALYNDATASPLDLVNGNINDGDAMVELSHLRYIQVTRDGEDIVVRFCASQPDETYIPLAHIFGDEVRKKLYLGMFEGIVESSTLKSKYSLTVNPTPSMTMDAYRACTVSAKKGSATYGLQNENTYALHTLLSMLWLRNTDFQGNVGNGNSQSDVYLKAGEGLNLTGGCLQGDRSATNKGVMVFWVWNKYADYWEMIDGLLKIADGTYWHNRTNKDFLTITSLPEEAPSNYDVCNIPTPAGGWCKKLSGDPRMPLMTTAVGGSSSTHYCDYFWTSSGTKMLLRGASRGGGAKCGPFNADVHDAPSDASSSIVARLQAFLAAE